MASIPPAAGSAGRPPLPITLLPAAIWSDLQIRQERLPLARLRHLSDWSAISLNEQRAVLQAAARHELNDDERYSLLRHHMEEVRRRAAAVAPAIVEGDASTRHGLPRVGHVVTRRPPRVRVPKGWVVWVENRRVAAKALMLRVAGQR